MTTWVPCGDKFITGDVIRWIEPIWKPKEEPTDPGEKLGYRLVTAQVMRSDTEWASLNVMDCKHHLPHGWTFEPLKGRIRRRRGPIRQGGAERALVGDHEARAIAASRYLNEPEAPVPEPPKAAAPHPSNWPPPLPRSGDGARFAHKGNKRGRKGPKTRHTPKRR